MMELRHVISPQCQSSHCAEMHPLNLQQGLPAQEMSRLSTENGRIMLWPSKGL